MAMRLYRLALVAFVLLLAPGAARAEPKHLLYFSLSAGFRHDVIPLSHDIVRTIGKGRFDVTDSEDVDIFRYSELRGFDAILFFTSGELPMNAAQKAALLDFVRSGRGFAGIHSATDTFYQWPEYLRLIGGYFNDHPWHQRVRIAVAAPDDPIVAFLAPSFEIADEIYQISDFDPRSRVLLRLDPASVDVTVHEVHPRFYGWPLAWTRHYGAGRVFYLALGHDEAAWRDARFQRLLLNGISWAIDSKKPNR